MPAGSYPSLTRHYQTVGLYNLVVAHRTLPDDLVYGIAEAVFANRDEMIYRRRYHSNKFHARHHPAIPRWRRALVA